MAGYYDETTGEFVETGDYGYNELDNTSGTNDFGDWTYTGGVWTSPSNVSYDLNYLPSVSGATSPWDAISKLFAGTSSFGKAGQLAGLAGLASLLGNMGGGGGGYAGYKGGIPKLTASREMLPIPQTVQTPTGETVPRRPGSGGISYFTPMTYAPAAAPVETAPPVVEAAGGGIMGMAQRYNLGGYSDGGRLLRGPGDGVSDDIPATIGGRQPARLANNEFVIPARIVSEIGNGSTDAGAKKLYQMMQRVQARRSKTVGKNKVAVDSGAHKEIDKL